MNQLLLVMIANLLEPAAEEKGKLLAVSADGKGIPRLRRELESRPVFYESERNGNRQMLHAYNPNPHAIAI